MTIFGYNILYKCIQFISAMSHIVHRQHCSAQPSDDYVFHGKL